MGYTVSAFNRSGDLYSLHKRKTDDGVIEYCFMRGASSYCKSDWKFIRFDTLKEASKVAKEIMNNGGFFKNKEICDDIVLYDRFS